MLTAILVRMLFSQSRHNWMAVWSMESNMRLAHDPAQCGSALWSNQNKFGIFCVVHVFVKIKRNQCKRCSCCQKRKHTATCKDDAVFGEHPFSFEESGSVSVRFSQQLQVVEVFSPGITFQLETSSRNAVYFFQPQTAAVLVLLHT